MNKIIFHIYVKYDFKLYNLTSNIFATAKWNIYILSILKKYLNS